MSDYGTEDPHKRQSSQIRIENPYNTDWCYIFDCLYYNFIDKHCKMLSQNYSTSN